MSGRQSRKEVEADINRQAKRLKSIEVGLSIRERFLLLRSKQIDSLTPPLPTYTQTQDVLAKVRRLAQACKAEPDQER